MKTPTLAEIWIYPIKSLDGTRVEQSAIAPGGSLAFDRRWAIVGADGEFVNAKREPRLHGIRSSFAADFSQVTLTAESMPAGTFELGAGSELSEWFAEFLGQPVEVREDSDVGFPDDLDSPGPTLISRASLTEMAAWFPPLTADDLRQRLRPNLVIDDLPAFGEDRFLGPPGERVSFRIGSVNFSGDNPCQRCAVPSRDPLTGEVRPKFAAEFATHREATLPSWAERARFNHFYRAALNTSIDSADISAMISLGDRLEMEGAK